MFPEPPGLWLLASLLGLLIGTGLGVGGLFWPGWARNLLGLAIDRPDGASEFRATYGGLFLVGHVTGLILIAGAIGASSADPLLLGMAAGACFALSALWFGTAAGRFLSILKDVGADTPFNRGSTVFEIAVGAAIAGPWLLLF